VAVAVPDSARAETPLGPRRQVAPSRRLTEVIDMITAAMTTVTITPTARVAVTTATMVVVAVAGMAVAVAATAVVETAADSGRA
jgi:hypothetical protein